MPCIVNINNFKHTFPIRLNSPDLNPTRFLPLFLHTLFQVNFFLLKLVDGGITIFFFYLYLYLIVTHMKQPNKRVYIDWLEKWKAKTDAIFFYRLLFFSLCRLWHRAALFNVTNYLTCVRLMELRINCRKCRKDFFCCLFFFS